MIMYFTFGLLIHFMNTLPIPADHDRLDFSKFELFHEKFDSFVEYLKIRTVFCGVTNPQDIDVNKPPHERGYLYVNAMRIRGGNTADIKFIVSEAIPLLTGHLRKFVKEHEDYDEITDILKICIDTCKEQYKEADPENLLRFGRIGFKVLSNSNWYSESFDHLRFEPQPAGELLDHFKLRRDVYTEFRELLEQELAWHLEMEDDTTSPYSWDSENAELEIAEILYAIKMKRLKINFELGSYAKFTHAFYRLFGLTNKRHDQKLQQIRNRAKKKTFLNEFVEFLDAGLQKTYE
jgi:hypothetical protein